MYAGIPAFWRFVLPENGKQLLTLSFVRLTNGWAVFAVAQDWTFYDAKGHWLTLQQLQQMPDRFRKYQHRGIEASAYITPLAHVKPPKPLRAQLQMPWKRFRYELRQLVFNRLKS
ncbi:MAG: hypothetical protein ETSY2_49700 [Candidatus Entotheonella gemina]|uniref:Uncharacterized protein n=1 Tax=Candidatus Entotheonella gemina TaxID=1429439 RepID=W4L902_9BACT|nr:MAG: hypothetical protein ETSY2_49700 [Candidatus Entotheonella gemina]